MKDRYKKGKDTYITSVDIGKVFDNVMWDKLFDVLRKKSRYISI